MGRDRIGVTRRFATGDSLLLGHRSHCWAKQFNAFFAATAEEHPKSATIHFSLACYAAQQRRFDETTALLGKATTLDAKFKQLAADGPDLAPYWTRLERR